MANITLEDLNNQELQKLYAPIIYLSILMVLGIPGNLVVLIIYRRQYKSTVYRTIIWNLAIVDFLFCVLTFPFNIGRLIRYYTFYDLWVCKLFVTIIIFFVLYSSHLLIILAVHRFRQVCFPLRRQITGDNLKYWIAIGAVLAFILDIPEAVLQPIDQVDLENNITGYVCAVSFKNNIYAEVYNGFLAGLFALYTLILFVLYILIGRRMYIQRRMRQDSNSNFQASNDEIANKITKIAVTVSAVFAISYIPLFMLKLIAGYIDDKELGSTAFAVHKIFERSYAFNHVANPYIYAFFDNRLRHQIRVFFMGIFCRLRRQRSSSERDDVMMRDPPRFS